MASKKKVTKKKKTSSLAQKNQKKKSKAAKKAPAATTKKKAKKTTAKKVAPKKTNQAAKKKTKKKAAKNTKKTKKVTIKGTRHDPAVFLLVHIALAISPLERLERFEEPIDMALGVLGQVSGGGSSLDGDGGVVSCDIEVEVHDVARSLPILRRVLTEGAAPKGTLITRLAPDGAFEVLDEL